MFYIFVATRKTLVTDPNLIRMKKTLLLLTACIFSLSGFAQAPSAAEQAFGGKQALDANYIFLFDCTRSMKSNNLWDEAKNKEILNAIAISTHTGEIKPKWDKALTESFSSPPTQLNLLSKDKVIMIQVIELQPDELQITQLQ